MDSDFDPFEDVRREPVSRHVRGKFQPRAKPQARKVTPAPASSVPPSNPNEKGVAPSSSSLDTSKSGDRVDGVDGGLPNVGGSALAPSVPLVSEELVKESVGKDVAPPGALSELMVSDGSNDKHCNLSVTEVDSLGLGLDAFSVTAPETAPSSEWAHGEFYSKSEPSHGKATSASITSSLPDGANDKSFTVPPTVTDKLTNITYDGLRDSVSSSLDTSEFVEARGPWKYNQDSSSHERGSLETLLPLPATHENAGLVDTLSLGAVISDDAPQSGNTVGDSHLKLEKSVFENADVFSGSECDHNFISQSTSITAPPSIEDTGVKFSFPTEDSTNLLPSKVCHVAAADLVSCNERFVHIDDGRLGSEESGVFSYLETPDILSEATIAECCARQKLQPKPRVQTEKEKLSTSMLPPDAVESVIPPPSAQFVPSETVYFDEGSIPACPSDDVLDYASMGLGDLAPPDAATSQFQVNEEQAHAAETSHLYDSNNVCSEGVPGVPEKESSRGRKGSTPLLSGGKPSRQLRKRAAAAQHVEETEDDVYDNCGFAAEPSTSSVTSTVDEEDNDYEYRVEEDNDDDYGGKSAYQKRGTKNSKKHVTEKEKPARKRKTTNEAAEQAKQERPKKFSRSTRRNKRTVNKDMLNIPEDELDLRSFCLRDIIVFADYKQRLAIKEEKASKAAINNQSHSSRGQDQQNEEDNFEPEQNDDVTDDQTSSRAQSNAELFNSQSFMERERTIRWSKQDTELFYEGIQQFGTDMSMIQQLFPGRTRHQMKLKMKYEERKHPLRFHEAMSNRATDHSYFEKVIAQLQQVAAQAEQESRQDDSIDLTGEEEAELNPETNEGMSKPEQESEVAVEDPEEVAEECNPQKADASDDDVDLWSSYKSEF